MDILIYWDQTKEMPFNFLENLEGKKKKKKKAFDIPLT